jgi:hypothetical protein
LYRWGKGIAESVLRDFLFPVGNERADIMKKFEIEYQKIVDEYGEYYLPDFGQFDVDGDDGGGSKNVAETLRGSTDHTILGEECLSDEDGGIILGRYAHLRKQYLKEHKGVLYMNLIMYGELCGHLMTIEREARELRECVVPEMAKRHGITEELKSADPMKWVGLMNNICASVDEMIFAEIIYV